VEIGGRTFVYKLKGRFHKEKWIYECKLRDKEAKTSAKAKECSSKQQALKKAGKKLLKKIKKREKEKEKEND
jgi:hypothetical protein